MGKGKNLFGTILTISLVVSFVCIAFGASSFTTDGNERKGKYMYRKSCRSCHDGSGATELSPNSKTMAQWERSFGKYERLDCIEEWNKLKQEDLNDIYSYLYNHAYDSAQPATCQ
jgi:hypothetical protein